MQSNLAKTLSYILEDEGSEFNVSPGEPGGASRYGVSVVALSDWNKRHGLPNATIADVGRMTPDLAGQIYTQNYLAPIRFDDLPSGVDYRLADIAVNLGVSGGATCLQLALGMWPISAVVDDATIAAVQAIDARGLILALGAAWIAKKHEGAGWGLYGHGWVNRANRAKGSALIMIGAT